MAGPLTSREADYPAQMVALHREMLHSAEVRLYVELERIVASAHRKRGKRDE